MFHSMLRWLRHLDLTSQEPCNTVACILGCESHIACIQRVYLAPVNTTTFGCSINKYICVISHVWISPAPFFTSLVELQSSALPPGFDLRRPSLFALPCSSFCIAKKQPDCHYSLRLPRNSNSAAKKPPPSSSSRRTRESASPASPPSLPPPGRAVGENAAGLERRQIEAGSSGAAGGAARPPLPLKRWGAMGLLRLGFRPNDYCINIDTENRSYRSLTQHTPSTDT